MPAPDPLSAAVTALRRQRAEAVREFGDTARQLACLVTERTDSGSAVHGMDLVSEFVRVLSKVAPVMDGRETLEATRIAKARAEADLRVSVARSIPDSSSHALETARFQGEPFFAQAEKLAEWRSGYGGKAHRLAGPETEPTRLERLAAAACAFARNGRDRFLGQAMARALEYGSPSLSAAGLKLERSEIIGIMASQDGLPAKGREEIACRFYQAFRPPRSGQWQDREEGRVAAAFRAAHGPDRERTPPRGAAAQGAAWAPRRRGMVLYETIGASLQPQPDRGNRGIGLSVAAA